jgi:hypothetical protein
MVRAAARKTAVTQLVDGIANAPTSATPLRLGAGHGDPR